MFDRVLDTSTAIQIYGTQLVMYYIVRQDVTLDNVIIKAAQEKHYPA